MIWLFWSESIHRNMAIKLKTTGIWKQTRDQYGPYVWACAFIRGNNCFLWWRRKPKRKAHTLVSCLFSSTNNYLSSTTAKKLKCQLLKAGPPLDFSFWSFLTFLHHGIEKVERHRLWKFHEKIPRKSWSNVPPKLLACIRFLYKVVHKIGRLRKFNRSREIEFNFFTAWTISIKFGTPVQHAPGYKTLPQIF